MKMNNKYLVSLMVAIVMLPLAFTVKAQNNFKLEVEQTVDNGNLLLDVFIQKTAGNDFPLGSSNLAVYLNNTALNLTQMTIDNGNKGPYDLSFDPSSYVNMSLGGHNYNFVNLSVLKNTSGAGTGQLVTATRTRVGRVIIPIVNQCEFNSIDWVIAPVAITNFSGASIKSLAQFVNPQPFPLCQVPATPAISSTANEFCQGTSLTLNSDVTGDIQWFKDGVAISGATTASLVVTEGGVYTAEAVNCICKSTQSSSLTINMLPLPTQPVVTLNVDQLTTTATGNLQWYMDGNIIDGATATTFEPTQTGSYTVMVTNSCGTSTSDPVVYNSPLAIQNFDNYYAFGAYPNPYNGQTKISYTLKKSETVKMDLYNSLGQFMTTIVSENKDAGTYSMNFSAKELGYAAGVYTMKMYIGKNIATIKLVEVE